MVKQTVIGTLNMGMVLCQVAALTVTLFSCGSAAAAQWRGMVAAEYRGFLDDPLDPAQQGSGLSVAVQPEFFHKWNQGKDVFAFTPFLRVDQNDDERTHADIRELTWSHAERAWELRFGVRKVFWGVTESQHLVDIINQTDLVENPDREDKLGQPMINLALIRSWGTLDLFVLPYFRERTFPGVEGRLRTIPVVDRSLTTYESSKEEQHIDLALRWSRSIGDWDLGVYHFKGTSRDPRFTLATRADGSQVLAPIYDLIDQTGIDVQTTKGSWLWKLEAIRRSGRADRYLAAVGGFEYTFYGVFGSAIDLGILTEYHYDERDKSRASPFDNDLFAGVRLGFNDTQSTELLAGCVVDLDNGGRFCNLEANRRLAEHWVLGVELRLFSGQEMGDPSFSLRRDDYVQIELSYHF